MSRRLAPLAVVIEPRIALAETVADCLMRRGYRTTVTPTHQGAAGRVHPGMLVSFLVAAVPAPG